MAHHSRLDKIVIDVAPTDHEDELAFWSGATGQQLIRSGRDPEYHAGDLPGQDVGVLIQRLQEGTARVHVDIHTTDVDAEVHASRSSARLLCSGSTSHARPRRAAVSGSRMTEQRG
jgi:hypothetical protein